MLSRERNYNETVFLSKFLTLNFLQKKLTHFASWHSLFKKIYWSIIKVIISWASGCTTSMNKLKTCRY